MRARISILILLVAGSAAGQTELFNFNFSSPPSLALQGAAAFDGGRLRLTSVPARSPGGAWYPSKCFLEAGFETMFQFHLGSGAEALVFVMQNNVLPALGRGESGLGYEGVPNSLAIEFDRVSNIDITDLAGAHVSVQTWGTNGNSAADWLSIGSAAAPRLAEGGIHTAYIRYAPGALEVFLDDLSTPLLSASVTITDFFPLEHGQAWFGFTGASGSGEGAVDVLNWSFHLAATPLTVSLISPLEGSSWLAPALIEVEAVVVGPDPIVSIEIFSDTQLLFVTNSASCHWRWDSMLPGSYTLTAVAIDSSGGKVTSRPVHVVINPAEPVIGVSFVTAPNGTNFALYPADKAGIIPQRHWNNALVFTNGNGSLQNLRNAAGIMTPIDIVYDFVSRDENLRVTPNLSHDHKIMRTYGVGSSANTVIRLLAVPYPIYDVIIYTDGANDGVDRVQQFRSPGTGNNIFVRDAAWTSFAGVYAAARGTSDSGSGTPAGNYVRLNGLTSPELWITNNARFASDGSPLASINAIQIVPSTWDRNSPIVLTRGPYLQMGSPRGMTIRWRSNRPVSSVVRYGTNENNLTFLAQDLTGRQEHTVVLADLEPNTRYFYSVGSSETNLISGTNIFFWTSPTTAKPTRVWVLGDSGTANTNAAAVRDAFAAANGSRYLDVWLMLGDNAYNSGTDSEFQAAVFDMYTNTLPQTPLWPAIGNHETGQSHTSVPSTPYLSIFNLPENGQAGGVPSGTERYYSFDYGNIHFVCLDSMTSERSTNGPMANWLRADLEANTDHWTIVFFHHPPYTKGSHDSDDPNGSDFELVEMRENIVPILEAYGVDLVLSGHSHCYERSYLLKGHYGYSTELDDSMILDRGSGNPSDVGGGPYTKVSDGTVYMVDGSSGQATFGSLNHPVMYRSMLKLGSVILDIDGDRLIARFLRETGEVDDTFTIVKQVAAPSERDSLSITAVPPPAEPTREGGDADAPSGQLGFLFVPRSQSTSVGADVLFLAPVFSDKPPTYQWRRNGFPISGANSDFLYLPHVGLSDVAAYDLVVTAGSLSITSQVAMLSISSAFVKVLTGDLVNEGGNSTGSAWGDFDNDGDLDVLVTHGQHAFNSLFRNDGQGVFTKLNAPSITTDVGNSTGGVWADYDNDGWLDVFVLNIGTAGLYRNNANYTFSRITNGIGAEVASSQTAAWGDYDRDGWLDLVTGPMTGGFGGPTTGGLYHNEAGLLRRITNGGVSGLNQAQSAMWIDFDGDADADLFFATFTGGFPPGPGHEILYQNGGSGEFALLTEDPLVSSGGFSTTASWADYDGDGDFDVFVGNTEGEVKFLFQNNGNASFTQVFGEIAEEEGANESAIWGDYDNDGWIDLFVANNLGGGNVLLRNTGSGSFIHVDVGSPTGDRANSVGSAWVDIDDDGFIDLFVTNLGDNNFLYRNTGNSNSWLKVRCAAYLSNRSAIGAKVRVLASIGGTPRWQIREIAARDSSGSPNSLRAEFGLGNATVASIVRVDWPSGLVTELHDVSVNQLVTVDEPPTISIADTEVAEGDTGSRSMDFAVRLHQPTTNVVTVDYTTRNGTAIKGIHYVATNGTLTFAPGESNQVISVAILGNLAAEGQRTLFVDLSRATNMPIGRHTATGTIIEDDPLTLNFDNSFVIEGNAGVTSVVFDVYLNKPGTLPVTLDFGTSPNNAAAGIDYVSTNGTISFDPGDIHHKVPVTILSDTLNEANEIFFFNVSNVVGASRIRFRASGTILDDDPLPLVSVTSTPLLEGNAGTKQLVFNVALSARSGRMVSFGYSTGNGSAVAPGDYVTKSGTISMPSGVVSTNIVVSVNGDTVAELDEVFFLNLITPVAVAFESNLVTAVIQDDDFRTILPASPGAPFGFVSFSNRYHRVERTFSLTPPVEWTTVPGAEALYGNGSTVEINDPSAAPAAQRFYRLRLLQ